MSEAFTSVVGDGPDRLVAFIVAREEVRRRREAGEPRPWTTDPILQRYRFCNVHREDDRVTTWIRSNWREPYSSYKDLWHLMVLARWINEPGTLRQYQERNKRFPYWSRKTLYEVHRLRKGMGARFYNPAYMITTAGTRQDKLDYICDKLDMLWLRRKSMRPRGEDTLNSWHMLLSGFDGLGSFLAGQVVADMRYVEPLMSASDLQSFACSGPGSRRGLSRVLGRGASHRWNESDWRQYLAKVHTRVAVLLRRHKIELHAQDLQNCLCEYDKHERARLGEGRPRQRYDGGAE